MATGRDDARRASVALLADAVDRRDVDAALSCLSTNVVVEVRGWGRPWHGRDAVAVALGELFATCEHSRCVIRESHVGVGVINDQVIFAAKSSRAATSDWIVTTATSMAIVTDGLVSRLLVEPDTDALRSQWGGGGLAAASVRSEVARIGFDPDAQVTTEVRAVALPSHRQESPPRSRKGVWIVVAAIVLIAAASAVGLGFRSQQNTPIAGPASTTAATSPTLTPTPTVTSTQSASASDLLGPSALPVAGGGVSTRLSGTVLFDRDSAVLKPAARALVLDLARTLRTADQGSVTVLGYSDNLGSATLGLRLSQSRADAVAAVFRQELASTQISVTAQGRGDANPVAPNNSETNRAKNRRVEIIYRPT
jgi:outer membrane protein OmpA-like peptidoglycan-associated protein/ketosteroid isomerase-like protein